MTEKRFVSRQQELALLDEINNEPDAQFVLVYGRRRVGKTTLLLHWARQTGLPLFYWVAGRDTPENLRANFAQALYRWADPDFPVSSIRPTNWPEIFQAAAKLIGERQVIFVIDELPYAAESDRALLSYIQAAWDHLFEQSRVRWFLCGSHIGMMLQTTEYQAPLYGRFTARLPVEPISFAGTVGFLPGYDVYQRMAVYAMMGGIPGYLARWRDSESVGQNIKRLFVRQTAMFLDEPFVLIGDLIQRETDTYERIIKAIALGAHTPETIGRELNLSASYVSPYLKRLTALHLVERRVSALVPPARRQETRAVRYYLRDAYLRFYYRFIHPNLHLVEQELGDALWKHIADNLRAFVGEAYEDVCRQWVLAKARAGELPFMPEVVGAHWGRDAQIDVLAINHAQKAILLGECKWGNRRVEPDVVARLAERARRVVPDGGEGWQVHYAFFAREGFAPETRQVAAQLDKNTLLLTLPDLERDLARLE